MAKRSRLTSSDIAFVKSTLFSYSELYNKSTGREASLASRPVFMSS